MNILVVGNGSAGKRHTAIARDFGLNVTTVDPYAEADYPNMLAALSANDYDIFVIASPPDEHIRQIALALDYGAWVLCEKPLCGFEQIGEFSQIEMAEALFKHPDFGKVTVSFNYRWHRSLTNGKLWGDKVAANWWYLSSHQYRPSLPSWGLLLDHVSHSLDILRWKTESTLKVDFAQYEVDAVDENIVVGGEVEGRGRFEINDVVNMISPSYSRRVIYSSPQGWTFIPPYRRMYEDMWSDFLRNVRSSHPTEPGLSEAIQTQYLLEQAQELLNEEERT